MHTIQESLKGQGIIELSEKEKLEKGLDLKFPNAQSKEIVTYNNQKFQKRFYLIAKSRSGKTVQAWGEEWVKI